MNEYPSEFNYRSESYMKSVFRRLGNVAMTIRDLSITGISIPDFEPEETKEPVSILL